MNFKIIDLRLVSIVFVLSFCVLFAVALTTTHRRRSDNNDDDDDDDTEKFIIPLQFREASSTLSDFHRRKTARDLYLKTRSLFEDQTNVGSVMTSGKHVDMPEGYVWKNSTIVIDK